MLSLLLLAHISSYDTFIYPALNLAEYRMPKSDYSEPTTTCGCRISNSWRVAFQLIDTGNESAAMTLFCLMQAALIERTRIAAIVKIIY